MMSSLCRSRPITAVCICTCVVCALVAFYPRRCVSGALTSDSPCFAGRHLTENTSVEKSSNHIQGSNGTRVHLVENSSVEKASNRSQGTNGTRVKAAKIVNDIFHEARQFLGVSTTENSTEVVDRENRDERIATIAGLNDKMPYYMVFVLSFVKPILMAMLFGPPEPGADFKVSRPIMLFMFTILPALAVLRQDAMSIAGAWKSNLNSWEACMATIAVLANSSNFSTLLCLFGLSLVYANVLEFEQLHGQKAGMNRLDFLKQSYGTAGAVTLYGCALAAVLMFVLQLLFILPAAVLYFWVALPPLVLIATVGRELSSKLLVDVVAWRMSKADGSEPLPFEEMQESQASQETHLHSTHEEYLRELDSYKRTGAPQNSWGSYVSWPALASVLPPLCTLALRFYCGRGYMASLTSTWNDRHLSAWADGCLSSAEHSLVNFISFII